MRKSNLTWFPGKRVALRSVKMNRQRNVFDLKFNFSTEKKLDHEIFKMSNVSSIIAPKIEKLSRTPRASIFCSPKSLHITSQSKLLAHLLPRTIYAKPQGVKVQIPASNLALVSKSSMAQFPRHSHTIDDPWIAALFLSLHCMINFLKHLFN